PSRKCLRHSRRIGLSRWLGIPQPEMNRPPRTVRGARFLCVGVDAEIRVKVAGSRPVGAPYIPAELSRRCVGGGPTQLVLLRHKFRRMFRGNLRAQHGQRGSILAIATTIAQWTVAIELGMCRWGRSGGTAGSVTTGNGRFREPPGGTWS